MIRDAELNLPNKTHVIRSISELTTTNALGPNLYLPPQFLHENLRKSTMPQGDSSPTTANLTTMGAFVHIGKTAGSTLSLLLRNGCHSFLPKPCRRIPAPESMASHLVGSYYHVPDFQFLPSRSHSFYILSLRDPFDRTISAFSYDHPLNNQLANENAHYQQTGKLSAPEQADLLLKQLAYRCFPSLEIFVDFVGDNLTDYEYHFPPNRIPRHLNVEQCKHLARAVLQSRVRKFTHLYFNYGKILSLLPVELSDKSAGNSAFHDNSSNTVIYATRKEFLWQDWKNINRLLKATQQLSGLPEENGRPHHGKDTLDSVLVDDSLVREAVASARNVSSLVHPQTRDLSSKGRRRLCRALTAEYQHYVRILRSAKNLNVKGVQESLAYSRKNCPDLEMLAHQR